MRSGLLLSVAAILSSSLAAHATVIDFNGSPDGGNLRTYSEGGFTVTKNTGAWTYNSYFGDPGPSIFSEYSGSILVTEGGQAFTFSSVDLANDVGTPTYLIEGFDGSTLEFSFAGLLPTDPLAQSVFRPYGVGQSATPITSLLIGEDQGSTLTNGADYTDVNIDNILLNAPGTTTTSVTPEPSSFFLLGTGLLGIAGVVRKRFA